MADKATQRRKQQNKGVANGTIRIGAGKRYVRKYNAKTGRWDKVDQAKGMGTVRKGAVTKSTAAKSTTSKPSPKPTTVAGKAAAAQKAGEAARVAGQRYAAMAAAYKGQSVTQWSGSKTRSQTSPRTGGERAQSTRRPSKPSKTVKGSGRGKYPGQR